MLWFYTYCLLPVLQALYVPLDWVLGWVTFLSPVVALVIAGAITGLAVNLFQKYCSSQNLLGRCKADLKKLKELQRAAKQSGDRDGLQRLSVLSRRISGRYMWGSLKPALLSVPALCVLATWTGSRLSFDPIRPGDEIEVTAYFEDGAAGFAHIVPNAGLVPVGAPIAPVAVPPAPRDAAGPQARWQVRAASAGVFPLLVRYNSRTCEVPLPVRAKGGRPPDQVTAFNLETPTHDQLLAVEVGLRDSIPAAWWNFNFRWVGLYLLVAVIFGVGLRRVLRIQ